MDNSKLINEITVTSVFPVILSQGPNLYLRTVFSCPFAKILTRDMIESRREKTLLRPGPTQNGLYSQIGLLDA